ncbi:uncharacterized mitochondrial protein-like protein, partial [Tanacetum coccineum]
MPRPPLAAACHIRTPPTLGHWTERGSAWASGYLRRRGTTESLPQDSFTSSGSHHIPLFPPSARRPPNLPSTSTSDPTEPPSQFSSSHVLTPTSNVCPLSPSPTFYLAFGPDARSSNLLANHHELPIAHSTVKWPIHKNTSFKNSNFNQRFNIVKDKNINAARPKAVVNGVRPKAVVNAIKGNNVNAVKASACWVWKPKTKVLDHGNPQIDLQDKGVIGSGCSRYMIGNMSYLTDYEEIDAGYVTFGGNPKGRKITGRAADFKLPTTFWAEAVNTACYVQNRVLVTKPHNKTPYELFLGRKLALGFMRPFGCLVIILNTIDHLGKFDGKADEGFFVGYSINSKAFRVFNSKTRIVEENLHVQFSENTPNIAGSGPNMLFDIDALTKSMNYKPVVAGNQSNGNAGTKACDDVGKARMETVPGKDYILLPLWTVDPPLSQSLKSSPNAGFKPSGDDEKKVTREPGEEGGDSSKDSESNDQEKEDNVSSTNTVNVPSINEVNVVGTKTSIEFPDDLNMPELEDIVYSDDDEDIGAEADMNNLDAFMPISSIPTTRIEEKVYVCQPPGFEDPDFPDRVYKVEKALYGLHQALRALRDKGDILLVQVYVDDIIFGSTKKSLCTEFEKMMHKKFQMSSMGEFTFFLGLQVKQNKDGIFIIQDKYVTEILKKFGFTDVKIACTPMETQKLLLKDEDGEEVDVHIYRSMIGSLMYLTSSRPDIMFAMCACARYQVNPKVSHLHAVKRIFRYLKGQLKLGLWYPKDSPFDLVAYTDMQETDCGCKFGASSGAQNLAFMTAPSTSSTNDVNTAKHAYEVSTVSLNVNTASPQVSTASFSDNVVYAFMVENPNGSNLLQQDLEQIHEDDLEAMDLKWQLSLLSMRAKRECRAPRNKEGQFKNQDNTRKQGNNEDTSSKAMLAIDGVGFDWSDMAEEQVQTNMALMAFSDSKVYNDKTCSKTCLKNYETLKKQCDDLIVKLNQTEFTAATYKRGLATIEEQLITYRKNEVLFSEEVAVLKREVACKDYEINVLKSEFEKVKQEKEGIEFKIEKFDNASKSLNKLLESQITDKSKKGLGYNVVPPPHPLIYNRPKKLDLSYSGLDEFKDPEFKSYGFEDSKQESNIVCDKKSDDSKENSDDSLVKEQVSKDTSSFVESSLNVEKETIFLDKKIEFVKPKNHEKPVKKSVVNTVKAQAVNTARPKAVNTARPKAVNTARPNFAVVNVVSVNQANAGKPQQDDTGFVDSGCSRHITGNIVYLSDFKEFDGGYVTFGGGAYGGRISIAA